MNNPYRNLLNELKASGATRLLSGVAWTTATPTPCGCLFGTIVKRQDPEFVSWGFFRDSWVTLGEDPEIFTQWAESTGLTQEQVEVLESFNDELFDEDISDVDAREGSDAATLVDYDRYATERYRLVVAHLEEKAAEFDQAHGVTP